MGSNPTLSAIPSLKCAGAALPVAPPSCLQKYTILRFDRASQSMYALNEYKLVKGDSRAQSGG